LKDILAKVAMWRIS